MEALRAVMYMVPCNKVLFHQYLSILSELWGAGNARTTNIFIPVISLFFKGRSKAAFSEKMVFLVLELKEFH